MSVMFVEPFLECGTDLTVRIVESGEFVRCAPPRGPIRDRNVIGWIGTNMVLVDKDDIEELAAVLDIVAVESWRPRVIEGGRKDTEASDAAGDLSLTAAVMDA